MARIRHIQAEERNRQKRRGRNRCSSRVANFLVAARRLPGGPDDHDEAPEPPAKVVRGPLGLKELANTVMSFRAWVFGYCTVTWNLTVCVPLPARSPSSIDSTPVPES